jgi:hypothetical protein
VSQKACWVWLFLLFVAACSSAGAPGGGTPTVSASALPFVVIDSTAHSARAINAPELVAVRDVAAWRALWLTHTAGTFPQLPVPDVDFSAQMVLAFFDAEGLSPVSITGVDVDRNGIHVAVVREDTSRCPGLTEVQHHAAMVRIARSSAATSFSVTTEPARCA